MAFPSSQNKEPSVLQYSPLILTLECDIGWMFGGHSIVTTDIGAKMVKLKSVCDSIGVKVMGTILSETGYVLTIYLPVLLISMHQNSEADIWISV